MSKFEQPSFPPVQPRENKTPGGEIAKLFSFQGSLRSKIAKVLVVGGLGAGAYEGYRQHHHKVCEQYVDRTGQQISDSLVTTMKESIDGICTTMSQNSLLNINREDDVDIILDSGSYYEIDPSSRMVDGDLGNLHAGEHVQKRLAGPDDHQEVKTIRARRSQGYYVHDKTVALPVGNTSVVAVMEGEKLSYYLSGSNSGKQLVLHPLKVATTDQYLAPTTEQTRAVAETFSAFMAKDAEFQKFLEGDLRFAADRPKDMNAHAKDKKFQQKLQRGTVDVVMKDKAKCTGFIYDPQTLVTAGHCFEGKDLLDYIERIYVQNDSTIAYARVQPGLSHTIFDVNTKDLAVTYFAQPLPGVKKSEALAVQTAPLAYDTLYAGRFSGYRYDYHGHKWAMSTGFFNKYGSDVTYIDRYQCDDLGMGRYCYEDTQRIERGETALMKIEGMAVQSGNSGGPIVNYRGEVVSIVNRSGYENNAMYTRGTFVNKPIIDDLKAQAKQKIEKK